MTYQIKEFASRAFIEAPAAKKLKNVDDVFRGFVKSPDGGVELEVEIMLCSDGHLETNVYIPGLVDDVFRGKNLTQD